MKDETKVYVNGQPKAYFPGMTVRFAIGPERARRVERGELRVKDSRGFITGLDGSLAPGEALFVGERMGSGG